MHRTNGSLALFLVALLGLACNRSGLNTNGAKGGQSGSAAAGGVLGMGGSGAGGGVAKDATGDAECLRLPCANPLCSSGYQVVTPPCGCPTCVAVDAGSPDAASDTSKLACVGLDECTCLATNGCGFLAQSCYCPSPQCDPSGPCKCGGGKFVGCAPANLGTCAAARDRVASLCPQLSQTTSFPVVCDHEQLAPECITECLNEVGSCGDIFCSFCDTCDCAGDAFSACVGKCRTALGGSAPVGIDGSIP